MEPLEGQTLSAKLDKSPKGLPWEDIRSIFDQCLAVLIHASEQGTIHYDLKPSNIFVRPDGTIKLLNPGTSRPVTATAARARRGSLDYMAPEFAGKESFRGDEVSDTFGLGACFYRALTGRPPFSHWGDDPEPRFLQLWRVERKPQPSTRHDVFRVMAREAREFIRKALHADRTGRYQTFAEMADAFRKIKPRTIKGRDEYEIVSFLGRGGFGEVYKARRLKDDSLVAVKWLFQTDQPRRFLKEAKILRDYPHEHMVKYTDFMHVAEAGGEGNHFLVMEHLAGMPDWCLNRRISTSPGGLNPIETLELFIHYLECLEHLHGRKIIHRDIKPGNLYAPENDTASAKVFDLGIARDMAGTVTTGHVPGTLYYMPPELAKKGGARGSPQSDIYSLGLSLYETLTGRPPLKPLPHDDRRALRQFMERSSGSGEQARFDLQLFAQYPYLVAIIRRAIALEPTQRYSSAKEMRLELEEARSRIQQHKEQYTSADTVQDIPTLSAGRANVTSLPATRQWLTSAHTIEPILSANTSLHAVKPRRFPLAAVAAVILLLAAAVGMAVRAMLPSHTRAKKHASLTTSEAKPSSGHLPQSGDVADLLDAGAKPGVHSSQGNAAPSQTQAKEHTSPAGLVDASATRGVYSSQGRGVFRSELPARNLVRVEIQRVDPDRPLAPPMIVEYRTGANEANWTQFSYGKDELLITPGDYTFRFSRADHNAVTRNVRIRPGKHIVAVLAPIDWVEKAQLFALRRLKTAWTTRPKNTRILTRALLTERPHFESAVHAAEYGRICAQWIALLETELPNELEKAEESVNEYLRWLCQVKDPATSLYRRQKEQPPVVSLVLPPLTRSATKSRNALWARMQRLRLWKEAATSLDDQLDTRNLARALAHLSGQLKSRHPVHALVSEFDSVLLTHKPMKIIVKYRKASDPTFMYCWRAHATYSPRISSMDALRDLEKFATRGGPLSDYDVRLALYSGYYTWQNAIEDEHAYAVEVNHSLGKILTGLDPALTTRIMTFLSDTALGPDTPDGNDRVAIYMIEALSFMPGLPHGSALKTQATRWLENNSENRLVAGRRKEARRSIKLLKQLLHAGR
jgi:serine/threonine protein kinase